MIYHKLTKLPEFPITRSRETYFSSSVPLPAPLPALRDNRPEILCHHWDPRNWKWPITKKADLIFFDPPYYIKKEKEYEKKTNETTPSISSYTKEEYERFLKGFLLLAHKKSKPTTKTWPS